MYQLYGIRHHGSGSAKSLRKALHLQQPDCILIEGPADADNLIKHIAHPDLVPPVAILIYNPKNLQQASYFPFAEFSPEWQAIKYGLANNIPVQFMDLPMSMNYGLDIAEANNPPVLIAQKPLTAEDKAFQRDPLGAIARLAGYEDSERWWEVTFEQKENEIEIFQAILDLMTAMRNDSPVRMESKRNLQREAFMRKTLRTALKKHKNIAVVCGAWHTPALNNLASRKIKTDNALLKGIKKVKTEGTWIAWSYERLSRQSGYGAGVISPAWYELLFREEGNIIVNWMTKVARLLREEDLDASSAHAIEAVRLADTLAVLRGLSVPGIEELKEAAVSIFCGGNTEPLDLIEKKLIVGDVIGEVPSSVAALPLQKDLEQQIKSNRLTKYWNTTEEVWLMATATKPQGGIDLRTPKGLMKSHLLHRLNLLNIPWGKMGEATGRELSNLNEYWKMKWQPDFSLRIIEAGMWGNTVYNAAVNFAKDQATKTESLPELTTLIDQALKADLKDAISLLMQRLQNLSALSTDILDLMDALLPLVRIIRYGNVRKTNIRNVEQLVSQFVPRITIGLPAACASISDELAVNISPKIYATHQAIQLLNTPSYSDAWWRTLKKIALNPASHNLLSGTALRLLLDKKIITSQQAATQMSFALSKSNTPLEAANWLEGFLKGSGALLLYDLELWQIVDDWLEQLTADDFQQILPMLRRTFANFSAPERRKMLELAQHGKIAATKVEGEVFDERAEVVIPTVKLLLGIR